MWRDTRNTRFRGRLDTKPDTVSGVSSRPSRGPACEEWDLAVRELRTAAEAVNG